VTFVDNRRFFFSERPWGLMLTSLRTWGPPTATMDTIGWMATDMQLRGLPSWSRMKKGEQ
jgi:hypothetical protein